jgi:heme oxygenase
MKIISVVCSHHIRNNFRCSFRFFHHHFLTFLISVCVSWMKDGSLIIRLSSQQMLPSKAHIQRQQRATDPADPQHIYSAHNNHREVVDTSVVDQVAGAIEVGSIKSGSVVESQRQDLTVSEDNSISMSLQSSRLSLLSCEHRDDLNPLSPNKNEASSVVSGGSSVSLNSNSSSGSSSSSSSHHIVPQAAGTGTGTGGGGCPYAVALQLNNSYPTSIKTLPPNLPGLIELKDCPAFANQGCPFKGAKSPDEISQTLAQIPSSHLDSGGVFMKTLAFYHKDARAMSSGSPTAANNNGLTSAAGGGGGGCPVKAFLPKDFSFDRALEEYSLASIMSRLAKEHELLLPTNLDDRRNDEKATNGNDSVCSSSNADEDVGDDDDDDQVALDELSEVQSIEDFEELLESTSVVKSSIIPPSSEPMESQQQRQQPKLPHQSITMVSKEQNRLSDALKSGTAQAHEAAESVHFVKNFIRGIIDRELYGLLVAQLFHVYQKLEGALEQYAPEHFAACHFPTELNRCEALQEDVDFWHTTSSPPISVATQDYLDRIDYLAKEEPLLLLAHAYTRYLGDLSGGKILARVAKRALQLEKTDEGLAFYQFDKIPSAKKFKDQYRTCLNELPLNEGQVQALVQEANVAFLLNMRLFEELDVLGGVPHASVRSLHDVYRVAKEAGSAMTASDHAQRAGPAAACPFANVGGAAAVGAGRGSHTTGKKHSARGGTCPWPFILLHDPKVGMKRWQTWFTIGLFFAFWYQQLLTDTFRNAVTVGSREQIHSLTETINSAVTWRPTVFQEVESNGVPTKDHSSTKPLRRAVSYSQLYQGWKDDSDSLN